MKKTIGTTPAPATGMPSTEKTGRIAGLYTTRLSGRAFTYEATWREASDGIIWSATLKSGNQLVATPTGLIRTTVGIDVTDEVRRVVENAIEARANEQ